MTGKLDRGAKVNQAVLEALKRPGAAPAAPVAPAAAPRPGARTWVGRVAGEHNAGLQGRIAELEHERAHGLVVLKLDPKRVRATELANRHSLSLEADDPEFARLVSDIEAQGQLEPIRVRPAEPESGADYEIVYGHRRHAACLALDAAREGGFPVLALLDAEAAVARDHVLKMYQENAARKDLSAYEIGTMFRGWLEAEIFADQAAVASAIGLSEPSVSKYLQVAALPDPVLAAFRDPRVIPVRWSEQLVAVLKANEAAVLAVAGKLSEDEEPSAPDVVLRQLLDAAAGKKRKKGGSQSETVKIDGRTAFAYSLKNERIAIRFGKHVDRQVARELTEEIKDLLTRRLKAKLGRGGSR